MWCRYNGTFLLSRGILRNFGLGGHSMAYARSKFPKWTSVSSSLYISRGLLFFALWLISSFS
ncbi:hypothetical protein Avbf_08037 [Armadillidium vulgare]|nr:hypothetical protein Avbf_08037 [Armadillidium vulgare]